MALARSLSGVLIECTQAEFGAQRVRVIRSERLAEDADCSLAVEAHLAAVAKVVQHHAEYCQDPCHVGVLWSVAAFDYGKRPFEVSPCCGVVAEVIQNVAQVRQDPRRFGMGRPKTDSVMASVLCR